MNLAMATRLNIGCGPTPTEGWRNYDNSWSVRLANRPLLKRLARTLGFVATPQEKMLDVARQNGVLWADVTTRIPEPDNSASAIYTSHMFEHLERSALKRALQECLRVLEPGGVLRIVVPDVRFHVDEYLSDGDADRFVEKLMLSKAKPKTFLAKMRYLIVGDRHHQWMYDGKSLCKLLTSIGFADPRAVSGGETRIRDVGSLDLHEREHGSVIVEAIKP
jgi:predicted SAM-dependent methyltransferase